MKTNYNPFLYLWAIGVLQPATPKQIQHLLEQSFPNSGITPSSETIVDNLQRWLELGFVVYSSTAESKLYSLSLTGNQCLPKGLRFNKDRTRLFLLKNAKKSFSRASVKSNLNSAGDSPSENARSVLQERRPEQAVPATREPGLFWPSPYKQQFPTAGKSSSFSGARLPLLSFDSVETLSRATGSELSSKWDLGLTEIALCMGVSPNLLLSMVKKKDQYYREFTIPKKSGGVRTIKAPRVFLKTVQQWLNDYILQDIPVHDACHAYRRDRSIVSNARRHLSAKFVANIDITDFFGNISNYKLVDRLSRYMSDQCVFAIEELCTFGGATPQGAPTSPLLSNFILFDFDEEMSCFCADRGCVYTRYADDMSISGHGEPEVRSCIRHARQALRDNGFSLNDKKTRIAAPSDQQRVTGVVVNEKLQPPRVIRKKIRATFHHASCSPHEWGERILTLRGYISYLQSFPCLKDSPAIKKYQQVVEAVSRHTR